MQQRTSGLILHACFRGLRLGVKREVVQLLTALPCPSSTLDSTCLPPTTESYVAGQQVVACGHIHGTMNLSAQHCASGHWLQAEEMGAQVLQAAFLVSMAEIQLQQQHQACSATLSTAASLLQQPAPAEAVRLTAARVQLLQGELHFQNQEEAAGFAALAEAQRSANMQLHTQQARHAAGRLLARAALCLGRQSLQQQDLGAAWQLSTKAQAHLSSVPGTGPVCLELAGLHILQQTILQAAGSACPPGAAKGSAAPQLLVQTDQYAVLSEVSLAEPGQLPGRAKGGKAGASRRRAKPVSQDAMPTGRQAQQARWRLLTQTAATFEDVPVISRCIFFLICVGKRSDAVPAADVRCPRPASQRTVREMCACAPLSARV